MRYESPEAGEETEVVMGKQVDIACAVCTEEFLVPIGVYRSRSDVLICPCCGSTDLVLLGVRVPVGERVDDEAA
jgi:hypothetical protein